MTTPNSSDSTYRRLFAGFDPPVEPPHDLATRLRLRVLAEAELDAPVTVQPSMPFDEARPVPPVAFRPLPAPPPSLEPVTPSRPAPITTAAADRGRRRQPWWLLAAEAAAGLLLLLGAAVTVIRLSVDGDRPAPRLGSAITAVSRPTSEPQILWQREDPDLTGVNQVAFGDDLVVHLVQDEHKTGILWWERYEYESFLQSLDRRTGEQRWLIPVENFGVSWVTDSAVLFLTYGSGEGEPIALVAFNPADGAQLWRIELAAPPVYAGDLPVVDDVAFLSTYDGQIRAIDLTDGSEVWTAKVRESQAVDGGYVGVFSSLTLDSGRLLTLDTTGGVVEIDPASGAITARHSATVTLPTTVYDGHLFVTADRLVTVVTGTDDDLPEDGMYDPETQAHPRTTVRFSAVDRVTGAAAWSDELAGNIGVMTQVDDQLVIERYGDYVESTGEITSGMPSTIHVRDLRTGDELWSVSGDPGARSMSFEQATTEDGQLLFGTDTGEVVSVDLDTGRELWRLTVGDHHLVMYPAVSGGLAITSDRPGHLVAIAIPENE